MKKFNAKNFIPYLGLIAILIVFSCLTGGTFLSAKNLRLIFSSMYIIMIGALGSSFVYATGNLDFSLGSLVGVTATLSALSAKGGCSLIICILISLAVGAATGAIIAIFHILFKLNPFIVSVTIMFAYRGLTWVLNGNGSTALPLSMYKYDTFEFKIITAAIVLALFIVLFKFTKLGSYAKAVGSNEIASYQSGIPVKKVKLIAFMLSGMFAGLAGLLSLIKAGTSFTTTGQMFECDVLIALTLGGMPLSGGSKARIQAAVIGAISLTMLENGLVLCGVNGNLQQGIKGLVLILILTLSYDRSNQTVIE